MRVEQDLFFLSGLPKLRQGPRLDLADSLLRHTQRSADFLQCLRLLA